MAANVGSYVVILDAGSSGTRLYGYRYTNWVPGGEPPKLELAFVGGKTSPGIARVENVGDHLRPLIDGAEEPLIKGAKDLIREHLGEPGLEDAAFQQVRLFMLGTAGMRDLQKSNKTKFESQESGIRTYLSGCGFRVGANRGYETITGEEEAAYGWIAANHHLGTFSELGQPSSQKVGYLEMGGASAQIAFRPHKNELQPEDLADGDITRITMGKVHFDLFLKTYDLGADKAWAAYQNNLKRSTTPENGFILDPDSPRDREWESGDTKFKGTGSFNSSRFHGKVSEVLDQLSAPQLPRGSRLLNENLIGTLAARRFVGGANFWNSTRRVFGRDKNGASKKDIFSFAEYEAEVRRTTMLSWKVLALRLAHDPEIMGKAWFVAEWVKCVLSEGFGFATTDQAVYNENDLSFRPYNGPDGAELTWTLGKMFHFVTSNGAPIRLRRSADQILAAHRVTQAEMLREKADHEQEMASDYLCMLASRPSLGDQIIDTERFERLKELARTAFATAWNLRQTADRLDGVYNGQELVGVEEQLALVHGARNEIAYAQSPPSLDLITDGVMKGFGKVPQRPSSRSKSQNLQSHIVEVINRDLPGFSHWEGERGEKLKSDVAKIAEELWNYQERKTSGRI